MPVLDVPAEAWARARAIVGDHPDDAYNPERVLAALRVLWRHAVLLDVDEQGREVESYLPPLGHDLDGLERIIGPTDNDLDEWIRQPAWIGWQGIAEAFRAMVAGVSRDHRPVDPSGAFEYLAGIAWYRSHELAGTGDAYYRRKLARRWDTIRDLEDEISRLRSTT